MNGRYLIEVLRKRLFHFGYHLLLSSPFKRHAAPKIAGLHGSHHHLISLDTFQPCSFVLCPKAVVGREEPVKGSGGKGEVAEGVPLLVTFEVVEYELKQLEREAAKRRESRQEEESCCARRLLVIGADRSVLKWCLLILVLVTLHEICEKDTMTYKEVFAWC